VHLFHAIMSNFLQVNYLLLHLILQPLPVSCNGSVPTSSFMQIVQSLSTTCTSRWKISGLYNDSKHFFSGFGSKQVLVAVSQSLCYDQKQRLRMCRWSNHRGLLQIIYIPRLTVLKTTGQSRDINNLSQAPVVKYSNITSHFNRHIWPWHCQPWLLIIQTNVKTIFTGPCDHVHRHSFHCNHRGLLKVVLTFVIKNQDQECLGSNMQLCSVMYDQKPRLIMLWSNIPALYCVTQHTGVRNCIHLLIVWDSLAIGIFNFQVIFPLARDLKPNRYNFRFLYITYIQPLQSPTWLLIRQTFFTGPSY